MGEQDADQLTESLLEASRSLVAVAARSLAQLPSDVTIPQFRVLVVLSTKGPQRAATLAGELRIAPSSLTRLCDRLATRNYVERTTAPTSRREIEIRLTPAGTKLVEVVTNARRVELRAIVDCLPSARRRPMIGAIAELSSAMTQSDADALTFGWPA